MAKRAGDGSRDDRSTALAFTRTILGTINNDRYTDNFQNQKALVYEVDPKRVLADFYMNVSMARESAINFDYGSLIYYIRIASEKGTAYLSEHNITYTPVPDPIYDKLVRPLNTDDNPESWFHELTKSGAFEPKDKPHAPSDPGISL